MTFLFIQDIINLANSLDEQGLVKEADCLDYLLLCLAMTKDEAQMLLGVSPFASSDDVNKAFKMKALQHHPDIGGDVETMKSLNVARDILLGERREERPYSPPPPSHEPPPIRREPKGKRIKTTWDEAEASSEIPHGVKWKFKTDTVYSSYLGDLKTLGFVVYGVNNENHVFVACFNHREQNAFTGSDIDVWKMWLQTYPISENLADIAPETIRDLWQNFEHVKGYNAKVQILPENTLFTEKLSYTSGRSISFKDAMRLLGESPTTWSPKNKVEISLELGRRKGSFSDYVITIVVDGKPYTLDEDTSKIIQAKSNFLRFVFGDYYYADSKKVLTKMQKEKREKALMYLVTKLEGRVEQEIIDALKKGASQ